MSTEITEGARVRVLDPGRYIASFRRRIEGRIGTVELVFTPTGGYWPVARVTFDARRKGSPTFTDTMLVRDLEVVA